MAGDNERLASVEAKLEFLKELLKEIRQDIKDMPSKQDYENLKSDNEENKDRLDSLESNQTSMLIKVGIGSGILSMLAYSLIKYLIG